MESTAGSLNLHRSALAGFRARRAQLVLDAMWEFLQALAALRERMAHFHAAATQIW